MSKVERYDEGSWKVGKLLKVSESCKMGSDMHIKSRNAARRIKDRLNIRLRIWSGIQAKKDRVIDRTT
jgi:hypothetical protein